MRWVIHFLFIFSSVYLHGQSAKCLPSAGHEYMRWAHIDKTELFLTEATASNYWDFGFLKSYYAIREKFEKASAGKFYQYFPNAQLVWKKYNGEEEYLSVREGALWSHGKAMEMAYKKSKWEIMKYEPLRKIVQTGMRKGQKFENNYSLHIKLSRNDLNIKSTFIPVQFDSLWLEISYNEKGQYEEDGHLSLDGNSSPVVRLESGVFQLLKAKGKRGQGKWETYDKFNGNSLPSELQAFLRFQRYTRVDFFSPDYVGPMVSYEVYNGAIQRIEYQNHDTGSNVAYMNYEDTSIVAYPNPSFGPIVIDLFNYPFDDYNFEIYNIVGKRIYSKNFSTRDGRQLKIDLSNLKRGTYMYSIFDGKGKKLVTKRVSLISI